MENKFAQMQQNQQCLVTIPMNNQMQQSESQQVPSSNMNT